jgi:serine/threonine protein kinase
LHKQNIVHRDIKPHNILCNRFNDSMSVKRLEDLANFECKISDMGVSKHLDHEHSFSTSLPGDLLMQSSQSLRMNPEPVGTIGWQAPEMVLTNNLASGKQGSERKTLAVDVFALGCVLHYVLSIGIHPFGEWFERESHIVSGKLSLDAVAHFPDVGDLLRSMLHSDPTQRPTSAEVCDDPFFWSALARIDFIAHLSDRVETERESGACKFALRLESCAKDVFETQWDQKVDAKLFSESGRFRKYDSTSMCDLIRLIRNKKSHFVELTTDLQSKFVDITGLWMYFDTVFPNLFACCVRVNKEHILAGPMNILNTMDAVDGSISPLVDLPLIDAVVWQRSALHKQTNCRGWWRPDDNWSHGNTSKTRTRPSHHVKAIANPRYRTRFCSHWDYSFGTMCSVKKGKCDFAHGCVELRAAERTKGLTRDYYDPTSIVFIDAISAARAMS